MSHAGFLRDHGAAESAVVALVRALWSASELRDAHPHQVVLDRLLAKCAAIGATWSEEPGDLALLRYVVRLTIAPASTKHAHVAALAAVGYTESEIADVVHVACCFSYMNRLADGLGVALDDSHREWAITLLEEDVYAAHMAWSARE